MFINLSNHSSNKWSLEQIETAKNYGEIVDIEFPIISSIWTEREISGLADKYCKKIIEMSPECVMCQGEFTFTYAVIEQLKKKKIKVLAACSERTVKEETKEDGTTHKNIIFKFTRFREYI